MILRRFSSSAGSSFAFCTEVVSKNPSLSSLLPKFQPHSDENTTLGLASSIFLIGHSLMTGYRACSNCQHLQISFPVGIASNCSQSATSPDGNFPIYRGSI